MNSVVSLGITIVSYSGISGKFTTGNRASRGKYSLAGILKTRPRRLYTDVFGRVLFGLLPANVAPIETGNKG